MKVQLTVLICLGLIRYAIHGKMVPEEEQLNRCRLEIEIQGLKNTAGQVGILVFNSEKGFPNDPGQALHRVMVPITKEPLIYIFDDLPSGKYAVTVLHDENKNDKLDTNIFGIPKEGYGVSRDAKGFLGPPKFADAVFAVDRSPQRIVIQMNY